MRIQGPASVAAPMNLALLGGGSAHTAAGVSASGLQSLRDHADRMMQQQRADAKNKEELVNQLKLKQAELQRLSTSLASQTGRNSELEAKLKQGDARTQELAQKMAQLTSLHDVLLESVHKSKRELEENKEAAAALDALAKGQDNAIQDLLGKYEALVAEKSRLAAHFEEVDARAKEARMQLAQATDREKALQADLDKSRDEVTDLGKQMEQMHSREANLESKAAIAARELSQAHARIDKEVAAVRHELETKASKQVSLFETEMKSKEDALQQATAAAQDFKASLAALEAEHRHLNAKLQASREEEGNLANKLAAEAARSCELQKKLGKTETKIQELQKEMQEAQARLHEANLRCTDLEAQVAAGVSSHRELQEKLAAEESSRQTAIDDAVAAYATTQMELESQIGVLRQKVEEAESQAHAAQQALQDAKAQASEEQEKLQQLLREADEANKAAQEELVSTKQAAIEAQAEFAAKLESHTGASAKLQVQRAVEQNNKQAQKALDDAKKKNAAEMKKVQAELKELQAAVGAAQKQEAEAHAALVQQQARAEAELQEALEKSNADNQAAVAAAVLAAKQVLSADLVQQHKAELARQAQKAVDDMAAERLAWERKVKAQTDLLRAQSTEQLEGLKLELDKRAAEDVRAIAEELAALHEQVEKGTQEYSRQAAAAMQAQLNDREACIKALQEDLHSQRVELVDLRQQLVVATEGEKGSTAAQQHMVEQKAAEAAQLREEVKEREQDLKGMQRQLELEQQKSRDLKKQLSEREQLPQAAVGGQLLQPRSKAEELQLKQVLNKKPPPPPSFYNKAPTEERDKEARRYTDVDDTDNESEAGPTPSTQGGGIFGLFKGTTPQNYKQQPGAAAAKRIKIDAAPSRPTIAPGPPDMQPSGSGKRSLFGGLKSKPAATAGGFAVPKASTAPSTKLEQEILGGGSQGMSHPVAQIGSSSNTFKNNRAEPLAELFPHNAGAVSGGGFMMLPKGGMAEGGKKSASSSKARGGGSRLKSLGSQPAGAKAPKGGLRGLFDG